MMDDGSSMITDRSLAMERMYKNKDKSKDEMKKLKARNKREIE
jgi:hypothetical protein